MIYSSNIVFAWACLNFSFFFNLFYWSMYGFQIYFGFFVLFNFRHHFDRFSCFSYWFIHARVIIDYVTIQLYWRIIRTQIIKILSTARTALSDWYSFLVSSVRRSTHWRSIINSITSSIMKLLLNDLSHKFSHFVGWIISSVTCCVHFTLFDLITSGVNNLNIHYTGSTFTEVIFYFIIYFHLKRISAIFSFLFLTW